jgi:serine/threonine protein kinase
MSKTKKNHYRNVVRCEFLGSGASGCKVYSCLVKGWRCAVKELSLALSNHFETECFRMEMNLLASLPRHPNVVQYLHHQEQKEGLQLFMTQYSSTLRQYLDKRREFSGYDALNPGFNAGLLQVPSALHHVKVSALADPSPLSDDTLNSLIDPQTVSGLAMKIAAGIQHLHHNCVLHRDLKSNNVFVCLDFSQRNITETVIGDFDTAIRVPKSYFSSSTDSSFNDSVDPVTIGSCPQKKKKVLDTDNKKHKNNNDDNDNDDNDNNTGTAGWMAPEVISGKKYGSAADGS